MNRDNAHALSSTLAKNVDNLELYLRYGEPRKDILKTKLDNIDAVVKAIRKEVEL